MITMHRAAIALMHAASGPCLAQPADRGDRPQVTRAGPRDLDGPGMTLTMAPPLTAQRLEAALGPLKLKSWKLIGRELVTIAEPVQPNS
jgi:hypothetical protein